LTIGQGAQSLKEGHISPREDDFLQHQTGSDMNLMTCNKISPECQNLARIVDNKKDEGDVIRTRVDTKSTGFFDKKLVT
ncbi:hypothetical protein COT47_02125, partial [Candidatus Woesearchaeota archaeon CG08_land_8_20_14_0_20_43_7]